MTKIRTAKIVVNSTQGQRCLGCVCLTHHRVDEYEVLDDANGETHWFKTWKDVRNYVSERICCGAFFMHGEKVIGDVLFDSVLG